MDKFSISSLCPDNDKNKNKFNANMNVPAHQKYGDDVDNLDIETLNEARKLKERNKIKAYKNILRQCYAKIRLADSTGITDIIYDVPPIVLGCTNYDSFECLKYVEEELNNLCLDTLIMTHRHIFISWFNLDENKKLLKKLKKK